MQPTDKQTKDWYERYYREKGANRNDLLSNPEVLFHYFSFEKSIITTLRRASAFDVKASKILDVGCGSGGSLSRFLQLGAPPEHLFGVDILEERIDEGRRQFPNYNLTCADATNLPYESDFFDLAMESTMFVQITDGGLAQKISREMVRVTKPGGYILLVDWRYPDYSGLTRRRISDLFIGGEECTFLCQSLGALVPPLGRAVSRYIPSMYFLICSVLPFFVGSTATLLQKFDS